MIRIAGFLFEGLRAVVLLSLLAVVHAYRLLVSPWIPARCRYQPTCSAYAVEALWRYGPLVGGWKAARRVGRCHPWARGGWDPP